MIIRSNLASAPIKNYSLFLLGCVLLGIVVVVFTAWNLVSLSSSYSKNRDLNQTIRSQQTQLQDLETRAKDLQTKIGTIKTPEFISETEFMNNAIKRRTLSWTALFDHFEEVLPPTVKMISVFPSVSEENIAINLEMAGKSLTDMLELVRLLESDPAFSQVILKGENATDDDSQISFTISLNYIPLETKVGAEVPEEARTFSPQPAMLAGKMPRLLKNVVRTTRPQKTGPALSSLAGESPAPLRSQILIFQQPLSALPLRPEEKR